MNAETHQDMEQALLAGGWKRVHASPFWKAPSGFMAASTNHAYECLKTGADQFKHCPHCGQEIAKR
jgi:hypothetical protein